MPETFLAADTHLGHRLMERIRPWNTLDEHDEGIIENWNKVVGPKDIVWHLGDVVMNKSKLVLAGRLNGRMKLVMGNHDTGRMNEYLEIFESLHGVVDFGWCVMTHVPVHTDQLDRFKFNVHGHLHDKVVTRDSGTVWEGVADGPEPDPRYFCVSMEQIEYTPILASVVRARLEERNPDA